MHGSMPKILPGVTEENRNTESAHWLQDPINNLCRSNFPFRKATIRHLSLIFKYSKQHLFDQARY